MKEWPYFTPSIKELNLFGVDSDKDYVCLWNSGPREALKVGKDRDPRVRPSYWTSKELTSSWLAMYLGSYFDRRYHCVREDKLS